MNMGWECPRCHRVWAPGVLSCTCVAPSIPAPTGPWGPSTGDPMPQNPTIWS